MGVSVVNLLLQYDWEFLLHDVLSSSAFSHGFSSSIVQVLLYCVFVVQLSESDIFAQQ